ncbi:hypothetical protein ABK040_010284 [Willaertia magna]
MYHLNSKTPKKISPSKRNSPKREGLVVGYTGIVKPKRVSYEEEFPMVDDLPVDDEKREVKEVKETVPTHTLLFPCISTVERVPRVGNNKLTLSTGVDFTLYPSSGCRILCGIDDDGRCDVGNAIFLTNLVGITPLHVVPKRKDPIIAFCLPIKKLYSPKEEGSVDVDPPFKVKDNLKLVRLPVEFGARSVMVPELPPSLGEHKGIEQPNCVVFSCVPPSYEGSTLEEMFVIKSDGVHFEIEKDEEVVKLLQDDVEELVNDFMVNHHHMIASYGFTNGDWVWKDLPNIQGHSCSTLPGYSGSAVRMIKENEYISIHPENRTAKRNHKENLQFSDVPAVPVFHGIHLQMSDYKHLTPEGMVVNQFIRTDSLSFIYLYSYAVSMTKQLDSTIFPSLGQAKASLDYLQKAKSSVEKMEYSHDVKTVCEVIDVAIKAVESSIRVFETFEWSSKQQKCKRSINEKLRNFDTKIDIPIQFIKTTTNESTKTKIERAISSSKVKYINYILHRLKEEEFIQISKLEVLFPNKTNNYDWKYNFLKTYKFVKHGKMILNKGVIYYLYLESIRHLNIIEDLIRVKQLNKNLDNLLNENFETNVIEELQINYRNLKKNLNVTKKRKKQVD